MANIRDIARLSGVSASTVSNIINGRYSIVRAQTRDRVLSAMRDLNYTPSPLFHCRDVASCKTIGVAFMNVDGYVMPILEGILRSLQRYGWNLTTINHRQWDDLHRNLRMYCDGRVDAMIVIDPSSSLALISALEDRNLPFVMVNYEADVPYATTVGVDLEAAAQLAVQHLIDLGHRRIGMLRGICHPDFQDRRHVGFVKAMQSCNVPIDEEIVLWGEYREESGYKNGTRIASLPAAERPTALFCGNDYIAVGAMRALAEHGISIPGDISVVGFDDIPALQPSEPPLTTVRRPLTQIGMQTAEVVMNLITKSTDAKPAPQTYYLPAELVVRASTAAPTT